MEPVVSFEAAALGEQIVEVREEGHRDLLPRSAGELGSVTPCDDLHPVGVHRARRVLWGTANLFSHRRFMAGAATNPDPDVFAHAAATIKACMDVTHELGGENYVLWGGREGYETLLNTDLARELDQMGRMLSMVVDYKHKIGFKGTILIEPKPQEPTKHQYDFDVATCYGFLSRYGLLDEVKVNIEVGHAVLAGHTFEHEVALAHALGIFGSIDMNRNDYQSGWDTDQFPNNVPEVTLAYYHILRGGGFTTGGTNFDARLRRQSIDPEDLLHGHIGAMDTCARALKAAAALIEDTTCDRLLTDRYAAWSSPDAKAILQGEVALDDLAARVERDAHRPPPPLRPPGVPREPAQPLHMRQRGARHPYGGPPHHSLDDLRHQPHVCHVFHNWGRSASTWGLKSCLRVGGAQPASSIGPFYLRTITLNSPLLS